MKLLVVRHAQVVIEPEVAPERWNLSAEGETSARRLADDPDWADVGRIWYSPQPKTAQTARVIAAARGLPAEAAPDLAELTMDVGFLGTTEFERRVGAYLEGADDPVFEPYAAAEQRVTRCVRDILLRSAGQDAAIVSHGRILTVLFAALCGERLDREAWRSIRLPDLSVVDLTAGVVERGFFTGRRVDAQRLAG